MQRVNSSKPLQHLNAHLSGPISVTTKSLTGPLSGLSFAIKDNICTTEFPTTCGSRALQDYRSPYNATVVSRLRGAGGAINGKTNLDEFGMGSHSIHSAFGPVQSSTGRSAGGSSGGSAVSIASGQSDCALGTDTGGSVRLPAAYNSIYGFKPSYGLVSRWGVVAYANSLDTVGYMAKNVKDLQRVHSVLGGVDAHDVNDPTSLTASTRQRIANMVAKQPERKSIRFGIPSEYVTAELSPVVRKAWIRITQQLLKMGYTVQSVSIPSTRQALSAYYILAPAEASSNLAKYDGVRYGQIDPAQSTSAPHEQLFTQTRQHGFGAEVRRRILLGAYSLSADAIDNYFMQAQRIRRLLVNDFDNVFALENPLDSSRLSRTTEHVIHDEESKVDVLICPTAPTLPPTLDEVKAQPPLEAYAGDVFTVPASLAGLPAISIPVQPANIDDLPDGVDSIGMQLITQYGNDEACLEYAAILEREL